MAHMDLCGDESAAEPGRQDRQTPKCPGSAVLLPPVPPPCDCSGTARGRAAPQACVSSTSGLPRAHHADTVTGVLQRPAEQLQHHLTVQQPTPGQEEGITAMLATRSTHSPGSRLGVGSRPVWQHFSPRDLDQGSQGGEKGSGCSSKPPQYSPPSPAAPTIPGSVRLGHLLLDEVLCFLPGEEDPGTTGQR